MSEPPRSMSARLRALLDAVVAQRGGREALVEATDEESSSFMGEFADAIGSSILQWRRSASMWRGLRYKSRDVVTTPGEIFELAGRADPWNRIRGRANRVSLDGQPMAQTPLERPVLLSLEEPGCFALDVDLVESDGRVVRREPEPVLVQVVDPERPAVVIDATLLLDGRGSELRRLGLVTPIIVDAHPEDRTALIREAMAREGLERLPVLVHPDEAMEFRTLGVDFRPVLVEATLRRLRAAGAPVVAAITGITPIEGAARRLELRVERNVATLIERGELSQRTRDFVEARAQAPDRFARRLDQMASARSLPGHTCRVELDNRAARERLFAMVEQATRSIRIQSYMIRPGEFTDQLTARLVRAARRGVAVRLMVDALYSVDGVLGVANAVIDGLRQEPGLSVVGIAPITSREEVGPESLKRRDHRKLVVVDGEVAWVSGRNLAGEYYTGFDEVAVTDWTPHERVPWLDAHVEVRGPVVADIAQVFDETWHESGGEPFVDPVAVKEVGSSSVRLVVHDGIEDAEAMLSYEAIIDAAQDHLFVVNDFPIVDTLFVALRRAIARGVRLCVLSGSAVARRADGTFLKGPIYREAFEYMTKHRLGELMHVGAEVYEYTTLDLPLVVCRGGAVRPYVHAKIVSADGRVASLGSANLDATASYWEREANLVLEDPKAVGELEARIEAMIGHSHRLDSSSESWTREQALRDLASGLWPGAVYS